MVGRRRLRTLLLAAALLASGCQVGPGSDVQWPRDAGGTLAGIRGGVLRVGVTGNPPWTVVSDGPARDAATTVDGAQRVDGAEARLVERLADRLGARVEWYPGSESALMAALAERVLHLVVGGLDAKAPWLKQASLTRPYVTTRTVVAVPPGMPAPQELTGVRVAVAAGTAEVAELGARDAVAVPLAQVTGATLAGAGGPAVAVGEWRLDELRLRATDHEIARHDHVWAVPLGENGWQVEVERFLLSTSPDEVRRLLVEAERRAATG